MKACTKCREVKDLEDYYTDRRCKDGKQSRCKECAKGVQRDLNRTATLRKYGLTLADYDAMYERQGGVCAICDERCMHRGDLLSVDHDHTSKRVRGLLCGRCNQALGLLRDRPELAQRAAAYLAAN